MKSPSRTIIAALGLLCISLRAAAADPPVFFKARGTERCAIVGAWIDGIQSRAPGIDLYQEYIPTVTTLAAPSFLDDLFVRYFGKPFGNLDNGDKRSIASALVKCWGREKRGFIDLLAGAFETNDGRRVRAWDKSIEAARAGQSSPLRMRAYFIRFDPYTNVARLEHPAPSLLGNLKLVPCPDDRLPGRFFSDQIYRRSDGVADDDRIIDVANGNWIDCALAGRSQGVHMPDILLTAAELFRRQVAASGIARGAITRAMAEGRFSPHWDDVALAWRGLVPMNPSALSPAMIAAMQRDGRWKDGAPSASEYAGSIRQLRSEVWQRLYGSYVDLPERAPVRVLLTALAAGEPPPAEARAEYQHLRETR